MCKNLSFGKNETEINIWKTTNYTFLWIQPSKLWVVGSNPAWITSSFPAA